MSVDPCVVQGCCKLPVMDCGPSAKYHIYVQLCGIHADKQHILDYKLLHPRRQTNPRCWNGTRGFFSRGGGGGAAEEQQTLEDIAKKIREQQYKRVVVMAGAGISTPSGIPDFR